MKYKYGGCVTKTCFIKNFFEFDVNMMNLVQNIQHK